MQVGRKGAVPLETLEIAFHAGEFGRCRYGVKAKGFQHPVINAVRDDEDTHARWTIDEPAMGSRTGKPDVFQGTAYGLKCLDGLGRRNADGGWIAEGRVGIPEHGEGLNTRESRVVYQAGEVLRQAGLPTNGHDLDIGESEVVPHRGREEFLFVASLDDQQLGSIDLHDRPAPRRVPCGRPPSLRRYRPP